jgi:integrase
MEHGIKAERLANGDVRYSVNIQVDGQRIHRVVGRESEGVTRAQAEALIEQLRTEARHSRLNLPKGRKLHRGFAEAADEYLRLMEETDGKNLKNKERHLRLYLTPHFLDQRLSQIGDFAVLQYAKKRRSAGASEGTINRELATFNHLYSKAIKEKWVRPDARPQVVKRTELLKPMIVLSPIEASALMAAAKADQDGDVFTFVATGLNSAMRHSEILRTRFDNISFEGRYIEVPKAKAGAREQPITQQLASILAEARQNASDKNGFVYPPKNRSKNDRECRESLREGFRRAVIAAGLDPSRVTPHTMRRTAITRLIMAGVPLPTIMRISGHKTMTMLLRYFHLFGSHVQDATSHLEVKLADALAMVEVPILAVATPESHKDGPCEQSECDAETANILVKSSA